MHGNLVFYFWQGLSLDDILQQAARVTPVHSANPSPMPKMPKETQVRTSLICTATLFLLFFFKEVKRGILAYACPQGEDTIPLQSEHRGLSKKSLHDAFHTAALAMGTEVCAMAIFEPFVYMYILSSIFNVKFTILLLVTEWKSCLRRCR